MASWMRSLRVFFLVPIFWAAGLSAQQLAANSVGIPNAPTPAWNAAGQDGSSSAAQASGTSSSQLGAQAQAGQDKLPGDKGDRIHYDKNGNPIQSTTPLDYGQQPRRIMGWIPNYRAVSVGAKPPPPSFKEKFMVGTQNTFDYSAFIFNAVDVEIPYVEKSYPEFGNGLVGYGRYYWHGFVDKGIGNYMTDTIVPTLTRQDSRYYAMGEGHWYLRALYAYTRVLITPNDAGKNTFNYSEIVGKGAAAGLGDLYYPSRYRTWTKTGQRWLVQVAIRDGGFNVFREFWPDVAKHVLHLSPKNQ